MSVAETMCDFIFMIFKGKKVLDGTMESIQDRYGDDTFPVHRRLLSNNVLILEGIDLTSIKKR